MNKVKLVIFLLVVLRIAIYSIHFICDVQNVEENDEKYIKYDYAMKVISEGYDGERYRLTLSHKKMEYDVEYNKRHTIVYIDEVARNNILNSINSNRKSRGIHRLEGVELVVNGRYESHEKMSNPGAMNDMINHLAYQSVGKFKMSYIIANEKTPIYLMPYHKYLDLNNHVYQSIEKQIDKLYKANTLGLVKAMILGDKVDMEEGLIEEFSQHGISHIIAISGLHIGVLYLGINYICRLFSSNNKKVFLYSLSIILLYNGLIGFTISCVRASVMMTFYFFSIAYLRPYDKKRILLITTSFYLLIRPFDVYNLGFLLSYLAVWSLFYIYPWLCNLLINKEGNKFVKYFLEIILVSVSINVGTFPVLVFFFNGVSTSSALANVLVVPMVTFLYLGSLLSLAISYIFLNLGLFLAGSMEVMTGYISFIVDMLGFMKFMYIKRPNLLEIILYYSGLLLLMSIKNTVSLNKGVSDENRSRD